MSQALLSFILKMTSKKFVVFTHIVLLAAFILASCSGNDSGTKARGDLNEGLVQFIGGPNGILVTVLDGAPPAVVTDDGTYPFAVVLALEDVGESDVGPGTENPFLLARVVGIVPEDFDTTREDLIKRLDQRIHGARKNYDGTISPGEITTLSFQPLSFLRRVYESEVFRLQVELCYDYSTHSSVQVCIKDDVRENLQDSTLCSLRSDLLSRNSGAPLHVISADQNPAGIDRIQVNFEIQNVAEGVFFSRENDDEIGSCEFALSNPTIYKALVVVHPVDAVNYELDCRRFDNTKPGFDNVVVPPVSEYSVFKFNSNAPRSFTCFLKKKTDVRGRVFQDMLNIDIYYRYGEFLDIPILIQEATG